MHEGAITHPTVRKADGGLTPSPRRSLFLTVEDPLEPGGIQLAVQIRTEFGAVLIPGTATTVQLTFWADEADLYIVPGRDFTLTYTRRVVGNGWVVEVLAC